LKIKNLVISPAVRHDAPT